MIVAILGIFVVFSAASVIISVSVTERSQHVGRVLQMAARQRTLAGSYVNDLMLVRSGARADPAETARLLNASARALVYGGRVPSVNGYDDQAVVNAADGALVRSQLVQAQRLAGDLTATGAALLAGRSVVGLRLAGAESLTAVDPVSRLRTLAALTANVSLNAARSIATASDANVSRIIVLQVLFGSGGLLVTLLFGWALIAATRRQTAHFRSLVTSSTDLVLVFGDGGCRYVSESVAELLGCQAADVLGRRIASHVVDEDWPAVEAAHLHGKPAQVMFRICDRFGERRHLEGTSPISGMTGTFEGWCSTPVT